LLNPNLQIELLTSFDYEKEDTCLDDLDIVNNKYISNFYKHDTLFFHAIVENDKDLNYYPATTCPVCVYSYLADNKNVKHATIDDYFSFLQQK